MSEAQQNWIDEIMDTSEPMESPEPVEQASQEVEQSETQAEIQPEVPAQPETQNSGETPRVPIYELYQARDRYKEAETRLQMQTDAIQQLRTQIEELRNPPPQAPDPEEDPAGYLAHENQQIKDEISQLRQENQQTAQQQAYEQKAKQVQGYLAQQSEEYAKVQPDFQEALTFARTQQYNNLAQQGYSQDQIVQAIYQDELREGATLLSMGYNAAEMIYKKALQWGYQPQQAVQPTEQVDEGQATDKQKEELQNLDAALQAAKGSGNKGGKVDLKTLIEAPDEQFNTMIDEIFPGMKKY